jgi:hypothetical protein
LDILKIKELVQLGQFRLSEHADRERENDAIEMSELHAALLGAELLEDYPEDKRGHSCLLLGFDDARPIHIVCAIDRNNVLVIITVYIPAVPKWKNESERNRPNG